MIKIKIPDFYVAKEIENIGDCERKYRIHLKFSWII